MKKTLLTLLMILCFLLTSSLIGCKTRVKAGPVIRTVDDDGPADFRTIQEAINNATLGEMIFVRSGIYYENVVVNKTVSLIGEDRDATIVDGLGTSNVLKVTANSVSISNFTLRNSGTGPSDTGIWLEHSSGNMISYNKIIMNTDGISFSSSNNNTFLNSIVSSNNDDGISFYSSTENVISGNTISDNNYGIVTINSDNNTICHNNFINNTNIFLIYNSQNIWDNGVEGNFWSEYTGQDLNGDGIGDNFYPINEDNKDNYPLMGAFSDFAIILKEETYHVATICNSAIADFRFKIGMETGNKIISFTAIGRNDSAGFCRIRIPSELMEHPYIVLIDGDEVIPTLLGVSNETYAYLYFTYDRQNQSITIISSELLTNYLKMQKDLNTINMTYYALLNDYFELKTELSSLNVTYNDLLENYLQLQMDLSVINTTYYSLLNNYVTLQMTLNSLNVTYFELLSNYSVLLDNYNGLRESFDVLISSYQNHLFGYSEWIQSFRNLIYVIAAATAIFIMITTYLSKHAHERGTAKTKMFEDRDRS